MFFNIHQCAKFGKMNFFIRAAHFIAIQKADDAKGRVVSKAFLH